MHFVVHGAGHRIATSSGWGCIKSLKKSKNRFGYCPYRLQEVIANKKMTFATAPDLASK